MNIRTAKQCEKLCDHLLEAKKICEQITRENSGVLYDDLAKAAYSAEKAIDIVKKDWGKDSSVNFSVQGMDGNGNYIVVVSDSNTVTLAFYSVNVSNETFTKREMN